MKRLRTVALLCALCIGCGSALASDDPNSPPMGIVPTPGMTLAHIMTLHRISLGKLGSDTPRTRVEQWAYESGGLTGTQTIVSSGKDYREDVTLGPFHNASGELAGKEWEQNRNGLTRFISGIHRKDDVNHYALAHALSAGSGVRFLGEVSSPVHAYVVEVAPRDGRVEFAYYDPSTYDLIRDERAVEGQRIVRTYDDFRVTSGLREPWHVHETNGLAGDDRDWRMQSLSIGQPVQPARLAIPAGSSPLTLAAPRVVLPATISGDRIIVTAQIGGRKVNFLLDSGASGILLNRSVADATGVKSFGKTTEVTAGEYTASDALVPSIDVGRGSMRSVYVETAPYADLSYGDVPIAGLLGYDFIAGCVVHVDYMNRKVEAIASASFTPPAGAVSLPVRLDDGVPVIYATVGAATGSFIVDTGADRSMLFSHFARQHPADVANQELDGEMTASLPFIEHISGVGGNVQVHPAQVTSLSIGSIHLPNWLFYVSQDAPSFESDDYAGLIGQDVLRNFDIYFDYGRSVLYLVPNDRYRERWGP